GGAEADHQRRPVLRHGFNRTGALDVSLDEVAAHAVVRAQRPFEVHRVARMQPAQVCAAARLRHRIDAEYTAGDVGDGKADAVHADAIAHPRIFKDFRGAHAQPVLADRFDRAEFFDDAGKQWPLRFRPQRLAGALCEAPGLTASRRANSWAMRDAGVRGTAATGCSRTAPTDRLHSRPESPNPAACGRARSPAR